MLVNNAGGQFFSPAELIAAKGWRAVWRLNVEGMLNMAEAAFELAFEPAARGHGRERDAVAPPRDAGDGALGLRARDRRGAHAGARAALAAGGRVGDGGGGRARSTRRCSRSTRRTCAPARARSVPLQRLGTVAEHAWLVALLASPLGRAFNGSTITLDGARDNWFGPWPPPGLADESGEVPIEERR